MTDKITTEQALFEQLDTIEALNTLIVERLDELETKIDNLNLTSNAGYAEVDEL